METSSKTSRWPRLISLDKSLAQLSTRGILTIFRALVFAVILVLFFFNEEKNLVIYKTRIEVFLSFFLASVLVMPFLKPELFEKKFTFFAIFLADIVFITFGLYLSGVNDTDLFLIFFTTVFISAISNDVRGVFLVAMVSCALYAFLHFKTTGEFISSDTVLLVRFPFLFIAAAMSGFLAMQTKKHRDERQHLINMNQLLAEQADMSIQKMIEINRKLKTLLEYHHCVLSSIQTGIIVARKDGKIRTFNNGARQITGYIEAEMAEKGLDELPENLEPVAKALQRTLEGGKNYLQENLELKTSSSEKIPVTLETMVLRGGGGEVIGAIATLKDMTLLRQMQTQLLRSEKLSALGEMAAGVAHEIKNPLNTIMGFSNRLSNKLTEPSLKKYADIIADEVKRLDTTISDVLEYSRPDRVTKAPVDMHEMLDETITFLNEKLGKARVTVLKSYSPKISRVALDSAKIRQVLLNLILNAIQAMGDGGRLTLKTDLIDSLIPEKGDGKEGSQAYQQLFLQQKMAAISVTDTGCGISKANLAKLFHPFYTTKVTGTGLGLSICHKIVKSHGGTLDVESVEGKGTTFTLYLPLDAN
jgi:PAS domain S-box-containing protein